MKKEEKLLAFLNDIDDEYIEEAMNYKPKKQGQKLWLRWGLAAAACLVIAACGVSGLLSPGSGKVEDGKTKGTISKPETDAVLPTLSVDNYKTAREKEPKQKIGNPSQQNDGNPWQPEAQVAALPVYENLSYTAESEQFEAPVSGETLDEEIQMTAAAIGMNVEQVEYEKAENPAAGGDSSDAHDGQEQEEILAYKATAQTDLGTITATCGNLTRVEFVQAQPLPEKYTVCEEAMDSEKAAEVTSYLLGKYGKMMGFSNPKASVRMFYDASGNVKWILSGYDDKGKDLEEQIVNYNLKRMRFHLNEQGQLTGIDMMDKLSCGKKIEEYPIITMEEAEKLLGRGEYVGNNEQPPAMENIEKASLVYLTGPECNIFMPYYAFDVKLGEQQNGLLHYSTYYVPAVKEEYLDKMPAADSKAGSEQGYEDGNGDG